MKYIEPALRNSTLFCFIVALALAASPLRARSTAEIAEYLEANHELARSALDHSSATVGPPYRFEREGAFPDFLQGKVFVYDWSRRWIKYGDMVDGTFVNDRESDVRTPPYRVEISATRLTDVRLFDQLTLTTPISMELGPDGSIYVAEYDGFRDPGENAQVTRYRWVADE
ncbi:MAG: hypothetical protein WD423_09220 [Rhodothermales bacterium]